MNARTPILVGAVLVIAAVAFIWFLTGTSKDRFGGEDDTYTLYADFDDASGIRYKTRLQVNGIDVGKIEDIRHVRGADGRLKARVELRLRNEYPVHENSLLRKVAESLLGDFRLDLDPGTPAAPVIPPGGVILNVKSLSDLEEIQASLKRVTANVNDVTESLSHVLAGPEGEGSIKEILANVERSMEAIERTTRVLSEMVGRNDHVIEGILNDLGRFSSALASASAPGGDLRQLTENLAKLSGRLDRVAASIDDFVGDGDVGAGRGQVRETVDNLNDSIARLSNITRKIDEGQGTLGRVVNDDSLITRVEDTLADTQQLIGGLSRLQTEIELRSQYEGPFPGADEEQIAGVKNVLGLRIIPRPDKYYLLEAISDPRGTQTRTEITTESNGTANEVKVTETSFNALKFSAQLAKRYYFLTLRFGIIENTGGLGANLHAWDDRLELRLDAFDFTRRHVEVVTGPGGAQQERVRDVYPRFRTTGFFNFANHLYLQAGIDDPFNQQLRTWFVGGALRFTDDDLKSLLAVAPSPGGG